MLNKIPEPTKVEQIKKRLEEKPLTIDARRPFTSPASRIWIYSQVLGLTSFYVAFWLSIFGIISPWAAVLLFAIDAFMYIFFLHQ